MQSPAVPTTDAIDTAAAPAIPRVVRLLVWSAFAIGLIGAAGRASQRLLWNDELFTLYVSQLSTSDIIRALSTGVDLHPPGGYLAVRAVLLAFGDGLVQARLVSVVGFGVACLTIGRFVQRRFGFVPGVVATLAPFVTGAYDYAFEARPYAALLGISGIALLCWQSTAAEARRRLALLGLGLAVAVAVSFHYFGVLLAIPVAAGELIRIREGRFRPGVWVALSVGLLPLLAYLPFLHAAADYRTAFWTRPSPGQLAYTYRIFLFPTLLPAAITLAAYAVVALRIRRGGRKRDPEPDPAENAKDDLAVCVALFLLPAAALAASYVTGGYHARYSILMALGFASLVGRFLATPQAPRLGTIAAVVLAVWVAGRGAVAAAPLVSGTAPDVLALHTLLRSPVVPSSLPIVVSDVATFIQLDHYAPPELRSRLRAITRPPDEQGLPYYEDSSVRALDSLASWHPVAVVQYHELIRRNQRFVLYGDPGWFTSRLSRDGAQLDLIGVTYQHLLILVTPAP